MDKIKPFLAASRIHNFMHDAPSHNSAHCALHMHHLTCLLRARDECGLFIHYNNGSLIATDHTPTDSLQIRSNETMREVMIDETKTNRTDRKGR